jgi:diguanylate cyclase (GGDEF)-like protein/PAS domain S-box-containing protein
VKWKRIPHQFVLAIAFSVIAIGLAVAIVQSTTTALREADDTIAYATTELRGIHYLSSAHRIFHALLTYRAELVAAQTRSARNGGSRSLPGGALRGQRSSISASIAAFRDRSSTQTSPDTGIIDELDALREGWSRASSQANVSADNVSDVIATIQPLLAGISGNFGLANDPSIDGVNCADAIVRFPLALAAGAEAASIAAVHLGSGDADLGRRFAAARLLAQAQTAVDVGVQDAKDELSVNSVLATPMIARAGSTLRDFRALKSRLTALYVEPRERSPRANRNAAIAHHLDAFTASSFAVVDLLQEDLLRITHARIEQAREDHWHLLLDTAGAILLELAMMLTLAWISIVSYQNQRKRMAAERTALELHRTELEAQLTHAKAQQALLRAKAQFRAVFDRAPIGMIIVDRQCNNLDTNEAAKAMLDASDGPVSAGDVIRSHAQHIEELFAGTADLYCQECKFADDSDRARWFHVSISAVHDESGQALFVILMIRDITDGKSMEAQLVFEAGHDALTGLPNRQYFLTMLQRSLDERKRTNTASVFSVVFIDFNDFKTINDSFGHLAGDKFLVDGAARLRDAVRSTDIVARVGGDEFAVILHGTDRFDIERSVIRLQSVVSAPVNIEGQLVASSASFGIAEAGSSYLLAAEIIRDADTAMYRAKAQGGRNYVVFDLTMREEVVRRMQLSIDLVHALEHDELELLYQPIVDLSTGKIAGCEALIRWRRSDGSLISPAEFLPLAEENGSIIEIGRWVTQTACEQMGRWNELSAAGRLTGLPQDFVIHVNLAVPEVHHADLLENLQQTLGQTNVARRQIILEITEGIVLNDTERLHATLNALTGEGFRLCIDDFGTGYSSLRYLNDLPLHCFKIDRSFVSNGSDELANVSIVEMLMVLSRSLDLTVVAEGIETHQQWESLRELGCGYGQGYLFAQPLAAGTLTSILERDTVLALPRTPLSFVI